MTTCHFKECALFQGVLATIMICVGDIGELIGAFAAAAFVFYLLVFIALIIMRFTHPNEPRPFKVITNAQVIIILIIMCSVACKLSVDANIRG